MFRTIKFNQPNLCKSISSKLNFINAFQLRPCTFKIFTSTKYNENYLSISVRNYAALESNKSINLFKFYTNRDEANTIFPQIYLKNNLFVVGTSRKYSDKKMVRILNVAEKNDAAKNLAEILSRGGYNRKEGLSKYNKIYEFETVLHGERCQMIMTSVSGHLLTHSFTGNYKKWYGCNPLELFDAPIIKVCIQNMEPIKATLEREAKLASRLIIWTDCDREGENIGFEVISVCKDVKKNLSVFRAKFSEITFQSVNRAFQNLGLPDENQNNAVEVRSELDLRIGASFTRFQTLRLKRVFPQVLGDTLISYGSCQFPTLGFVVERYKAIEEFIPEEFWKIKVSHEYEDCVVDFNWRRVRLFDQLACEVILDRCQEDPRATVTSVRSKTKSKWRPKPLDTVELEKLASRKLHMNAKETMRVAEKLYTGGFISYPRTETNIFPKELDLAPLVRMQVEDQRWGGFASRVLDNGPSPRQGNKSDQAHPPIHPTKYAHNLQGNEQKVYEFVVRHFLACCDKDAKGTETVVQIAVAEEEFLASGLIILERNYLDVYPYDRWSDKEMPNYQQGHVFEPTSLEMVGGQTSPPPLLTEADLISLMEKHGIGTDATHADHIETIKNRSYVGLQDTRFVPGELGMGLVEGYDAMGFHMSKPHLRAGLEADLKKICEGKKDPKVVLREQVDNYRGVFREALNQASKIDTALGRFLNEVPQTPARDVAIPDVPSINSVIMKCPSCGGDVVAKTKRDNKGFYLSCQLYPQCKVSLWLPIAVIGLEVTDDRCTQCPGTPRRLKFRFAPRSYTPILPTEYTSCIAGCDTTLLDTLDIQAIKRRDPPNPGSSQDSGYSSSSSFTPNHSNQTRIVLGSSRTNNLSQNGRSGSFTNSSLSQSNGRTNHSQDSTRTFPPSNRTTPTTTFPQPNRTTTFPPPNRPATTFPQPNRTSSFSQPNRTTTFPPPNRPSTLPPPNRNLPASRPPARPLNNFGAPFTPTPPFGSQPSPASRPPARPPNNFGAPFTPTPPFGSQPSPSTRPPSSFGSSWGNSSEEDASNAVVCGCNENALKLTVRKEGPNTGRQFYKCRLSNDSGGCNFFLWADDGAARTPTTGNEDRGAWDSTRSGNNGWNPGGGNSSHTPTWGGQDENGFDEPGRVTCKCGQDAKKLTTMKEGPNQGREFFTCPKTRGEQCGYFQWVDEMEDGGYGGGSAPPQVRGRGRGRGSSTRGRGSSARGPRGGLKRKAPFGIDGAEEGPQRRKCGLCGEEGHNRRNCPHS